MDSLNNEVNLEVLDLGLEEEVVGVGDVDSPPLSIFPCLVLSNVTTEQEITLLLDRCKNYNPNSDKIITLYLEFSGLYREIGKIELTLDTLLMFRYVSEGYKLKYYISADDFKDIDINDPKTLEKFI